MSDERFPTLEESERMAASGAKDATGLKVRSLEEDIQRVNNAMASVLQEVERLKRRNAELEETNRSLSGKLGATTRMHNKAIDEINELKNALKRKAK